MPVSAGEFAFRLSCRLGGVLCWGALRGEGSRGRLIGGATREPDWLKGRVTRRMCRGKERRHRRLANNLGRQEVGASMGVRFPDGGSGSSRTSIRAWPPCLRADGNHMNDRTAYTVALSSTQRLSALRSDLIYRADWGQVRPRPTKVGAFCASYVCKQTSRDFPVQKFDAIAVPPSRESCTKRKLFLNYSLWTLDFRYG